MDGIRHAICQGRVLANEGRYELAIKTWKAALNDAYALHDYAGMFVLSMDIGEACVRIAMRSKETSETLLNEAVTNLDYALQIVEQCALQEVLMDYRVLYQGVRCVEALKRRAQQVLEKLGQRRQQIEAKDSMPCSTCGNVGLDLLLDKNDECYYCKRCYEEYYAASNSMAFKDVATSIKTNTTAVDGKITTPGQLSDGKRIAVVHDLDRVKKSEDAVDVVVAREKQKQVAQNTEGQNDRVRYDRVELGSLAEFLAGKTHTTVTKQDDDHWHDLSARELPVTRVSSENGGSLDLIEKPVATIDSRNRDTEDHTSHKIKYPIAQLMEVRKLSPIDCPSALLTSPVRDTALSSFHYMVNSSIGAVNARKMSSRSATSLGQSTSRHAEVEAAQEMNVIPLPTQDLCTAMRQVLQEHQELRKEDNLVSTGTSK